MPGTTAHASGTTSGVITPDLHPWCPVKLKHRPSKLCKYCTSESDVCKTVVLHSFPQRHSLGLVTVAIDIVITAPPVLYPSILLQEMILQTSIYSGTCLLWSLCNAATCLYQPLILLRISSNVWYSISLKQPPVYSSQKLLPQW